MSRFFCLTLSLVVWTVLATSSLVADEKVVAPFNGKDLSGWKLKGDNKDKSKWTAGVAKVDQSGKLTVETAR